MRKKVIGISVEPTKKGFKFNLIKKKTDNARERDTFLSENRVKTIIQSDVDLGIIKQSKG